MRRQLHWYGASPLHLLALLACFGLAGYASARLFSSQTVAVVAWFLGAVIGHDLLLLPLYSLADRSVMAAFRHRAPELPALAWINYIRVPAALSGLLLLVWFPLILRLPAPYSSSTGLSADPYVWHWLAVTGTLFMLSAVAFALRLRRQSRTAVPPEHPAAPPEHPAAPPEHPAAPPEHPAAPPEHPAAPPEHPAAPPEHLAAPPDGEPVQPASEPVQAAGEQHEAGPGEEADPRQPGGTPAAE